MVDFTNLQVYGVPVITYLLVGVTTGVLAYATSIGGIEKVAENAAKSIGDVTSNPASVLSSPQEPVTEPVAEPVEEPSEEPAPPLEENAPSEPTVGGKKNKKHTPKSKSKSKSKKQKKHTKRSHK